MTCLIKTRNWTYQWSHSALEKIPPNSFIMRRDIWTLAIFLEEVSINWVTKLLIIFFFFTHWYLGLGNLNPRYLYYKGATQLSYKVLSKALDKFNKDYDNYTSSWCLIINEQVHAKKINNANKINNTSVRVDVGH